MAVNEKSIIKTEAHFSEDKTHRYLLTKEWDNKKKKALVIMKNPSYSDGVIVDHTTMFVINNLYKLDYGSVDIANIFSKIDTKIRMKDINELVDKENDEYVKKAAEQADTIIIAWGSAGESSKKIRKRQESLLDMIKEYKDKLQQICDERGVEGFHPLAPSVRGGWILKPYKIKEGKAKEKKEYKQKGNTKKDETKKNNNTKK